MVIWPILNSCTFIACPKICRRIGFLHFQALCSALQACKVLVIKDLICQTSTFPQKKHWVNIVFFHQFRKTARFQFTCQVLAHKEAYMSRPSIGLPRSAKFFVLRTLYIKVQGFMQTPRILHLISPIHKSCALSIPHLCCRGQVGLFV